MITKELLFDVINATVGRDVVSIDELDDIINEFVKLHIVYNHGSIENYENYVRDTYGINIGRGHV